jgi:hypothetical protein
MSEILDLLFGFLFVACWFIYLKLISIYTGWSRLGKEFGTNKKFDGKIFQDQKLGSYTIHHIGLNDEGIYLSLFFTLRPFHKPIFIPWSRIKFICERPNASGYYMRIDGYSDIKFFLSDKTYEIISSCIPVISKPVSNSTSSGP